MEKQYLQKHAVKIARNGRRNDEFVSDKNKIRRDSFRRCNHGRNKKITSATSQQISDAAYKGTAANRQYYIEIVDKKLHPQVDAKLLKEYDQVRMHLLHLCGAVEQEET